jgi:hypothetical protein
MASKKSMLHSAVGNVACYPLNYNLYSLALLAQQKDSLYLRW